ncbi:hypothetical protein [Streptomyces sp. NPDC015350]|uniref:hypothetical protein n=1 Tax=Streptomyces sp. NPDC015350 TaxID=3364955 RepID=UPI0036FE313D
MGRPQLVEFRLAAVEPGLAVVPLRLELSHLFSEIIRLLLKLLRLLGVRLVTQKAGVQLLEKPLGIVPERLAPARARHRDQSREG